jgi:signal transduction histidine kinase
MGFSENLIAHWHQVDDVRRLASVEKIQRASGRLDLLVRDLLYVSRIDSGSLALKLSQQLVLPLLHQAVEELAIKFPGQTVEVGDELRHASVWVDVDRTVQVIGNVLDNAAKYSPEGSPITVTWDAEGRWGTLSVHDTGPGIKPEDVHKLFRRFSKLDSVTRAGHIGTGLGLYICSQLVDKMGGGIWYEPNRRAGANTGATFRIRLPLTPSSHAVPELTGSRLALKV